jgi:hypothetical protein
MVNYCQVKHCRGSANNCAWEMSSECLSNPVKTPQSAIKGTSEYFSDLTEETPRSVINNTAAFTIGDTKKVLACYKSTLKMFNQKNCESLILAIISIIKLYKWMFYPYSGCLVVGQP